MVTLHVPLADVLKLAQLLQYEHDTSCGPGVSAKQIERAERVIRRLVKEHLQGKWERKE